MSGSVIEAVLATCERVPDRVALSAGEGDVCYEELAARIAGAAQSLQGAGVDTGCHVAVALERSPDLIVGLLAVLACGAAYVPLDPAMPPARLEQVLRDCRPTAVLARPNHAALANATAAGWIDPATWARRGSLRLRAPGSLAYIAYTSGSSGAAKGVMVEHASLENYLSWCLAELPLAGHGVPLFASVSFDHAVTCYLPPLLKGDAVVLLPPLDGGRALASGLLAASRYSYVKITPSHLRLLDREQRAALGRRTSLIVFGGERLTGELVADVRRDAPELAVVNHYGPTEATVGCCTYRVPPGFGGGAVPIGTPIPGVAAVVRRADLAEAAVGEPGELHVGGRALARGYWGQPELTAGAFVHMRDGDATRWYRTGDLVVRAATGELTYVGRVDDQVKVLGHRVEPGEIEHALRLHPQVADACVLADPRREPVRLVGAVALASGTLAEHQLRRHLRLHVPAALVPARLLVLERLPVTQNGKVDRQAILDGLASDEDEIRTRDLEEQIARAFVVFLGTADADADADFFELGGDSLASVEAVAWISDALHVELEVSALFEHPTPRALARYIRTRDHERPVFAGLSLLPGLDSNQQPSG